MLNHGRCGSVLLHCLHLGNQTGFWLQTQYAIPVCTWRPSGSHEGGIKEHVAPGKWHLVVQRWPCFDPYWLSRLWHPTQLSPHAAVTRVFSLTLQGDLLNHWVTQNWITHFYITLHYMSCFDLFYGCFEDKRRLKGPRLQNRAVILGGDCSSNCLAVKCHSSLYLGKNNA